MLRQEHSGYIYLWAREGAGRSHLLHAACAELSQRGDAVGYVPLDKRTGLFRKCSTVWSICRWSVSTTLSVLQAMSCGRWRFSISTIEFWNRAKTRLLITGDRPPRQLNLGLPDLASRLDWGQIYKLQPLSDEDKLQALQLRARLRGFELPEDVGRFLLKRLDREMRTLFMTLDQLDRASITAQRKLTIPFVKEILKL